MRSNQEKKLDKSRVLTVEKLDLQKKPGMSTDRRKEKFK